MPIQVINKQEFEKWAMHNKWLLARHNTKEGLNTSDKESQYWLAPSGRIISVLYTNDGTLESIYCQQEIQMG
jgi:hypothetical protein